MKNKKMTEKRTLSGVRTPSRKPTGTRIGTLADWRSAGNTGTAGCRHGLAIRDGR